MASPRPWPVLVLLLLLVLAAAPFTTTTQAHTLPAAVAPARASKCVSSPDFPQNCTIRVASLPNCIASCLNKTTGVETCACCMAGLRLLPNKQCEPCPTGSFALMADNVCSPCHEGRTTTGPGSSVCSVCAAGYGWRPPTVHTGPWCQRCPQCSYGPGNTTAPCKACDPGFTTDGPGASECIPAVCASLPDPVPGVAAWPSKCTGTSSCTASCTAGFSGEVTAVCGCDQKWLAPTTTCEPEASQIWRGTLRASKTLVAAGSSSELLFTVKFDAALPATAGPVKLYNCGATPNGPPGILGLPLADMMDDGNNTSGDTADGDGIYSVKLAVQFTRSNESRCYTVVVGAAEAAPGTAPIDMGNAVTVTSFAGCSSPPPEVPEGTSYPWDHPAAAAQCRDVPVDFVCSANCREPYAYGPGRISRCLGGDVWTGPTGFCEPWVCTSDPFPQLGLPVTCERKGQAGYAPGALCTAPCPQGRSGSGYKALCTQSRTWEVTVECTGNCTSLPSPDPPGSYSDRWAPTCIGLAENQTCTAECSCSGAKFVAECDTNGSYVVKPGACNACPGPIINGDLEQGLEMSFTQVIQSGSFGAFFWGASSQLYNQFNNFGMSSLPLTNADDASHGNFATSFPTQPSSFVHFTRHGPVARGSILTFDFKVMNLNSGGSYYYSNTMNFRFSPNQQVRVDLMNPAILTTPGATFFGPASDWVIASVLGQQEVVAAGFNLWKTVKFDLSAYQGQTLLIALRTTIERFFLFASWDNVQVTAPRLSARKAPAKVSRKKTNVLVQGPNGCNQGGCKPFASRAVHG